MVGLLLFPFAASAADTNSAPDISDLPLEQLINIKVTSVSKKETKLESAPAAVTVITQDDIRRMGIENIPDALRLVPGMDVAQINAHEWAVSVRGFNDQYANKLLVLVDGRAVYTPAFGGVYWDVQDMPMEDIDRIEVIRGPGGTLWGENAVNGVVNIITKSAKDTQGMLVSAGGGVEDQPYTTVRYGGQLATNLYYRAYLKYFNGAAFTQPDGSPAADQWHSLRAGGRMDWDPETQDKMTLQGDYYYTRLGENVDEFSPTPPFSPSVNVSGNESGGNVLTRWMHEVSDTSQFSVQVYDDYFSQQEVGAAERQNTFDLDAQHRFSLVGWNDIVWGLGYRYINYDFPSSFITINPGTRNDQLVSGFIQDEMTVIPDRLHFTIGTKLERNDYTGFELEPSVRLAWTPTEKQTVWGSVSRAVRTPSIFNLHGQLDEPASTFAPVVAEIEPNPNLKSEILVAYELGYRIEPVERLSFDAAAYYDDYDGLVDYVLGPVTFNPTPFPGHPVQTVLSQNGGDGDNYGGEVSAQWQPLDNLRIIASYSLLKAQMSPASAVSVNAPQQQAQLRAYFDIMSSLQINGMISYVDRVTTVNIATPTTVPAYTQLDLGLVWHPIKSVELGIWGQNLLQPHHLEFTSDTPTYPVEIPRSVLAKITVRF